MTFERQIASAFKMTDEVWERHANPWSVWTRFSALPLLILAIWSRVWLGWWSLVPTVAVLIWIWINPRVFPKPRSTGNWASKAVLGERVWLNRTSVPIPEHHRSVPHLLNIVSFTGVGFLAWGLIALEIWPMVFGIAVVYFGKLWFVDRMVWLYEDMKDATTEYRSWLY